MMKSPGGKQVLFAILFALLLVTVGLIGVESWNQSRKSHPAPAPTVTAGAPAPAETTSTAAQTAPAANPNSKAPKPAAPVKDDGRLYNM